jgi:transcriptional regulator with XRE-family HTH domain
VVTVASLKQQRVGEHARRLRVQAGMSLRTLARQTGFSASFVSQLENGRVSPSISSMEKIAAALGATLGEFFAAAAGGEGGLVVRKADRQAMTSGWSKAEIEALSLARSMARLEVVLVTLRPGGRSGKHPYPHPREEFAFVVQGEVMLSLGPEEHRLRRGDAATILPGELRLWRNEARSPARILIVTSPVPGTVVRDRRTRRGPTSSPASGRRRRAP